MTRRNARRASATRLASATRRAWLVAVSCALALSLPSCVTSGETVSEGSTDVRPLVGDLDEINYCDFVESEHDARKAVETAWAKWLEIMRLEPKR